MTSISKHVYIDKLNNIVDEYNNTDHTTIKMKPTDVEPSTYIESSKEINYQDPKFKIGDIVRISKYKTFMQKAIFQIDLKRFLRLRKLKIVCLGHMYLNILMEKKLLERFMKNNCKKQIKRSLELKK